MRETVAYYVLLVLLVGATIAVPLGVLFSLVFDDWRWLWATGFGILFFRALIS